MESLFSSRSILFVAALSSSIESFFTGAFYLLQELAGLGKLAQLVFRCKPPLRVVRQCTPPKTKSINV
jgi:hypothetical protein